MDKDKLAQAKEVLRANPHWHVLKRDLQLGMTTEPEILEATVDRIIELADKVPEGASPRGRMVFDEDGGHIEYYETS